MYNPAHVFHVFSLKTTFTPPKLGRFWGYDPLNGVPFQQIPQKAHRWAERRHMMQRSSKSVDRCNLWAWQRDQTRQRKKSDSGKLAIHQNTTASDQNAILQGWCSLGGSCNFQNKQQTSIYGPFSRTTRVSQCLKGKTNLDFTEARDSEWQWHQLGHMQVCTSLQTDNHASNPPL